MQSLVNDGTVCTMCGDPTTQLCGTCSSSSYCSRECQKADWSVHKILCNEYQDFITPQKETYRRAIFFPQNANRPRFVWVDTAWDGGFGSESAMRGPFLGTGDTDRVRIGANYLRSRNLPDTIEVVGRDTAMIDGSPLNTSVMAVTKGGMRYNWCGPILAMKCFQSMWGVTRYFNMDMVDFRDVVDMFLTYRDTNLSDMTLSKTPRPPVEPVKKFTAVRINCTGHVGDGKKFDTIEIRQDHPVFHAPSPLLSQLINIPIRIMKCSPCEFAKGFGEVGGYDRSNKASSYLQLGVDSMSWGTIPEQWQEDVGSVIVVHAGRKPLLPQHMDALCYFCEFVMLPELKTSKGSGSDPGDASRWVEVMGQMSPVSFQEFYEKYNESKAVSEADWDKSVQLPPYP